MEVVDLKSCREIYLQQYVDLRNQYKDLLLCELVTLESTIQWLGQANVSVKVILSEEKLLGAAILYFDRKGEVAFFALEKGRGWGSILLKAVEKDAINSGLPFIWAWMLEDNIIAQRNFAKNGFAFSEPNTRIYNGMPKKGVIFMKKLLTN